MLRKVHCYHYSGRIHTIINLYWKRFIGDKHVYSLTNKRREIIFAYVCNKIQLKVITFCATYGRAQGVFCFGEPVVFKCTRGMFIQEYK